MSDEYDVDSCNAAERVFYRPIEAALRWCCLTAHEAKILREVEPDYVPKTGQFLQWPCLQANTEKILDAIEHKELPRGRDGKPVPPDEPVTRAKLTVRHTDLREWFERHHPGDTPAFLFKESERPARSTISAAAYQDLEMDRDMYKRRFERLSEDFRKTTESLSTKQSECDSLRAIVDKPKIVDDRSETTYLNIIGGLLGLMRGKTPAGVQQSVFFTDAAIISALLGHYEGKPGIKVRTLEEKFAAGKRSLKTT